MVASKEQMSKIYTEYSNKITRYIRSKVFNQQNVDDLVNNVFIKIFTKYDSYDETKASLSTWIYRITSNTVTDYIRKNSKISAVLPDSDLDCNMHDNLIEQDAYQDIFTHTTLEILAEALKKLDERERDLIVLKYYKNEKLKKIAVMMNMSYSNTKIIHKKALSKLESYMNKQLNDI